MLILRSGACATFVATLAALGCSVTAPPRPPPYAGGPAAPPPSRRDARAALGEEAVPPAQSAPVAAGPTTESPAPQEQRPAAAGRPAAAAGIAPHTAAEGAAPVGPFLEFETPYKLGQAPTPRGQAEAAELERWDRGGRGDPPAPAPPPEGHPLPRVIVDVLGVKGPLKARDVQRIARQALWIEVVQCYRRGAYKDQALRGKVTVRLTANRAGKVTAAKSTASTLPDAEVSACFVSAAKGLALPRARRGSTITATMQVYPGDDPVEPPPSVITPGDGVLAPPAVLAAAATAVPAWRACYETALATAPELWGRLAVRFHVSAEGRVDEAFQHGSSFPDEGVVRCALRAARKLSFPPPERGDLRFVLPIRLSPGGAQPEP